MLPPQVKSKPAQARPPRPRNPHSAFSLVEVVLALGLLSFAAVAIIGLLPVGLSTLRDSMDQTVEAQILRTIGAQSVTGNFTSLANTYYFDNEGQPLEDANNSYYQAKTTTVPPVYPAAKPPARSPIPSPACASNWSSNPAPMPAEPQISTPFRSPTPGSNP